VTPQYALFARFTPDSDFFSPHILYSTHCTHCLFTDTLVVNTHLNYNHTVIISSVTCWATPSCNYRGIMTPTHEFPRWWCRKTPWVCVGVGEGRISHLWCCVTLLRTSQVTSLRNPEGQAYVNLDLHPYLRTTTVGTARQIPPRRRTDPTTPTWSFVAQQATELMMTVLL